MTHAQFQMITEINYQQLYRPINYFKGTVHAISSDPLFKELDARFTAIPFKYVSVPCFSIDLKIFFARGFSFKDRNMTMPSTVLQTRNSY